MAITITTVNSIATINTLANGETVVFSLREGEFHLLPREGGEWFDLGFPKGNPPEKVKRIALRAVESVGKEVHYYPGDNEDREWWVNRGLMSWGSFLWTPGLRAFKEPDGEYQWPADGSEEAAEKVVYRRTFVHEGRKYFGRLKFWYDPEIDSYQVAFICHPSRRVANDWLRKGQGKRARRGNGVSSGWGGIAPLRWALQTVLQEAPKLPFPVIVTGADQRRLSAYRRLLKKGWVETPYHGGGFFYNPLWDK
jgi:hypothetical protein